MVFLFGGTPPRPNKHNPIIPRSTRNQFVKPSEYITIDVRKTSGNTLLLFLIRFMETA